MSKKGLSIIVFLCLLAMGNGAYGVFRDIGFNSPETRYQDNWHNIGPYIIIPAEEPLDSNFMRGLNWGIQENSRDCIVYWDPNIYHRPPDVNVWACIEAKFPEPNIYEGDVAVARLSIYPWLGGSQISGEQGFALTVGAGAGNINCGVQIGLADKLGNWHSMLYGYAILNVFGGTMYTPGYTTSSEPVVFCSPSGLYIGGGPLTYGEGMGLNYGTVNMYGGSIIVPGICINYGDVNLFGGLLYETNESPDNLIISARHARNKINIEGGKLRLQGDRPEQVWYYYSKGRICPCNKHGILFIDYNGTDTSVTALCTPGSAWDPTPADRATQVVLNPTLTWSAGNWVQAANGHGVYFGTDFNAVSTSFEANDVYKGRQDANSYNPGTLLTGTTYYWRIDEYKDGNPDSPWKGQIWQSQTRGGEAIEPKPKSGAIGLPIPLQLNWTKGTFAADTNGHDVYFGTSEANVTDANVSNPKGVYQGRQDSNVFLLSSLPYKLAADTNYYWRVDEINDTNIWKGETWHFVDTNYFIIDDFESYANTADMSQRWHTQYSGAGGMLTLYEGAMQYDYDNSGLTYLRWSEARFDCNDGNGGADWTGGGALPNDNKARSLAISYFGEPNNAVDPNYDRMYVAIEDTDGHFGSIIKNSNPEAQRTAWWTMGWEQWNINLADLNSPNDVNLKSVRYLYLGFGVRDNTLAAGGTGTVFFDSIRLYQRYCVLTSDFTDDCVVNLDDLKILSEDWLHYGQADIYADCVVDFRDFALLASQWLTEQFWPE